ncbi:unnamed protein product [Caenorhabditis bovis]|uniref:Uncharacterized protein n=1 Tax=Caenorhabditis bovis TaxID=2654633 RepID=A0A8S1E7V2_9PELO|nr:unnamed protein product [Caenorhabditis bovis]
MTRNTTEVSVVLNVRPLHSSWKPVQQVDCPSKSAVGKSLESNIWKAARVKTLIVSEKGPNMERYSTDTAGVITECGSCADKPPCSNDRVALSPIVEKCECTKCNEAEIVATSLELSPTPSIRWIESEQEAFHAKPKRAKAMKIVVRKQKNDREVGLNNLKTDRFLTCPSPPLPPPPPPSLRHKNGDNTSQISIPSVTEMRITSPTATTEEIQAMCQKITNTCGEKSPEWKEEKPAESSVSEQSCPEESAETNETIQSQEALRNEIEQCLSSPTTLHQMVQLFYSAESNMWLMLAVIIMMIFVYRSSVEQHTCYIYD